MRGCDIASYQGTIDFDALRPAVSFVIAKATEGIGYVDPTFERNWSEAGRVGLRRGAYHFARPDAGLSAEQEATYFLSHLGPLDADALLALDYEVDWDGDVVWWCKEWLDLVAGITGIKPLIYLNLSLVRGYDWTPVIEGGYPLWLARYDGDPHELPEVPWPKVAIKQYTSSGILPGIMGRVDLDEMYEDGGNMDEPNPPDPHLVTYAEFREHQADVRATIEDMKRLETKLVERLRAIRDALKEL